MADDDKDADLEVSERDQVMAGWPGASPPDGFAARVAGVTAARRSRRGWLVPTAVACVVAAAALVVGLVVQRRQTARERTSLQAEVRRIGDAAAVELDALNREADRINRDMASVQVQLLDAGSAAERDRLRLQLELQQAQLRANAERARTAAAKVRAAGDRTKHKLPKVNLDVDTSNAAGAIQGK